MSRFDRNDVDPMDRYEERPIDVQDLPADGEPWPSALGRAIDPAEHAYHAVLDAFGTLECELAKCSTTDRALVLRRLCDQVFQSADRIALASTSKLEDLVN